MFRIGIDVRGTEAGFKAHFGRGTGRYGEELLKSLTAVAPKYPDISLVPLGAEALAPTGILEQTFSRMPVGRQTLTTQFVLPRSISRTDCNLLHFLSHGDAPARSPIPYIVTVLDLIPLRFSDLYRADKPNWRFKLARGLENRAITQATGILAISECTKRDLVELLHVPAEKVIVTPLAVSKQFVGRPLDDELPEYKKQKRAEFGLDTDRPLLLYVGGIDPRKNVSFLLEVFAKVQHQLLGPKPLLVLGGAHEKDDQFPILQAKIKELGIADSVKWLGFVPEQKLVALYHSASLFLFPSLYEGFGFPVLEAMACGVPVLAGDNSSIPEVAGSAAHLLPDNNIPAWVGAIKTVLEHPLYQLDLSLRGVRQAKAFSWEQTARKTFEAYKAFLKENPYVQTNKPSEHSHLGA